MSSGFKDALSNELKQLQDRLLSHYTSQTKSLQEEIVDLKEQLSEAVGEIPAIAQTERYTVEVSKSDLIHRWDLSSSCNGANTCNDGTFVEKERWCAQNAIHGASGIEEDTPVPLENGTRGVDGQTSVEKDEPSVENGTARAYEGTDAEKRRLENGMPEANGQMLTERGEPLKENSTGMTFGCTPEKSGLQSRISMESGTHCAENSNQDPHGNIPGRQSLVTTPKSCLTKSINEVKQVAAEAVRAGAQQRNEDHNGVSRNSRHTTFELAPVSRTSKGLFFSVGSTESLGDSASITPYGYEQRSSRNSGQPKKIDKEQAALARWGYLTACLVYGTQPAKDRQSMYHENTCAATDDTRVTQVTSEENADEYIVHPTWICATKAEGQKKNFNVPRAMMNRRVVAVYSDCTCLVHQTKHGEMVTDTSPLGFLIMSPESLNRWFWALLGLVILTLDLVTIPMETAGLLTEVHPTVQVIMCIYWGIDLLVQFLTGYDSEGLVEMRASKTVRRYLTTWLVPDMTILTIDIISLATRDSEPQDWQQFSFLRTVRVIRIVRLLRTNKLNTVRKLVQSSILSVYLMLTFRLVQLIFLMLTLAHYVACIWYGVALRTETKGNWLQQYDLEDADNAYRYIVSLHWSLCQFTPATNNIAPFNVQERVFANCVAIFALVVFSSFISNITNAVNELKMIGISKVRERRRIQDFISRMSLSTDLGVRIQMFFNKNYSKYVSPIQEKDLPSFIHLPERLRIRLHEEMYMPMLKYSTMFRYCETVDRPLLVQLCHLVLSEHFHLAEQDVFIDGAECDTMRHVLSGHMMYLDRVNFRSTHRKTWFNENKDSQQSNECAIVSVHTWLSEISLWAHWLHAGQLTALTPSQTVHLDCEEFRCTVLKMKGQLFRVLKLYAIVYVNYAEEMSRKGEHATDMPISDEDAENLVLMAQRFQTAQKGPAQSKEDKSNSQPFASLIRQKLPTRWKRIMNDMNKGGGFKLSKVFDRFSRMSRMSLASRASKVSRASKDSRDSDRISVHGADDSEGLSSPQGDRVGTTYSSETDYIVKKRPQREGTTNNHLCSVINSEISEAKAEESFRLEL